MTPQQLQIALETVGYLKKKASQFKYLPHLQREFEERVTVIQNLINFTKESKEQPYNHESSTPSNQIGISAERMKKATITLDSYVNESKPRPKRSQILEWIESHPEFSFREKLVMAVSLGAEARKGAV